MEALNAISKVMYLPPVKTKLYKYSNIGSMQASDLKQKLCRLRDLREFQQEVEDVSLLRHIVCYEKHHSIDMTPFFSSQRNSTALPLFDAFATLPIDVKLEAKQKVDAGLQNAFRASTSNGKPKSLFQRLRVCVGCGLWGEGEDQG
jgi:hypothetical protein